jgi:hypothetical protein
VPEISTRLRELDGDLPSAARFWINVHHAAFTLFFREAIYNQDPLAEFYAWLHVEQPAV